MVPQVVSNVEPSEEGLGDVEAWHKRQDSQGALGIHTYSLGFHFFGWFTIVLYSLPVGNASR